MLVVLNTLGLGFLLFETLTIVDVFSQASFHIGSSSIIKETFDVRLSSAGIKRNVICEFPIQYKTVKDMEKAGRPYLLTVKHLS